MHDVANYAWCRNHCDRFTQSCLKVLSMVQIYWHSLIYLIDGKELPNFKHRWLTFLKNYLCIICKFQRYLWYGHLKLNTVLQRLFHPLRTWAVLFNDNQCYKCQIHILNLERSASPFTIELTWSISLSLYISVVYLSFRWKRN